MDSAPPRPDRGDRIRRLVLLALLALVAAVSVGRAVDLIRHGWRPTAPGERRWLEWASGNRWERAVRAALPERPPPVSGVGRELVVRVTAAGPVRPDWVQVMAQYRWPAHRVLAVEVVDGDRSGPPQEELPATPELEIRVSEPLPEPLPGRVGRPEKTSGLAVAVVAGILALAAILAAVLACRRRPPRSPPHRSLQASCGRAAGSPPLPETGGGGRAPRRGAAGSRRPTARGKSPRTPAARGCRRRSGCPAATPDRGC